MVAVYTFAEFHQTAVYQITVVSFLQLREVCTLSRIFPSKGEGLLQDSMKNTSNTLVRKCLYIRIYENKIRLSHKDK